MKQLFFQTYCIMGTVLSVLLLTSCVNTGSGLGNKNIGQAQITNFETRTVDAPFDAVFSAATEAIFDLGYKIEHSDKQSGIIVGEKQNARKDDKAAMAFLFGVSGALLVNPIVYNLTIYIKPTEIESSEIRIKTTIDGEPQLNKQDIDRVWVYIDRQTLMNSPPLISEENNKLTGDKPFSFSTTSQEISPSKQDEHPATYIAADTQTQAENIEANEDKMLERNIESEFSRTNDPNALIWLDKSYQTALAGSWAESIRTASIAIKLDPGLENAYVNRAWAYNEKGLYEKALDDCNNALKINPLNAAAINNRGLAYQKMNHQEKAIQNYRSACEMGLNVACQNFKAIVGYLPSEEIAFYQKQGVEAFSSANYNDVINATSKVIELDPNNAEAYSTRCAAKANIGLLEEANQDCEKSIECNPDFSMAYNNLGYILELEGAKKEASVYYEMSCGLGNQLGCKNQQRITSTQEN